MILIIPSTPCTYAIFIFLHVYWFSNFICISYHHASRTCQSHIILHIILSWFVIQNHPSISKTTMNPNSTPQCFPRPWNFLAPWGGEAPGWAITQSCLSNNSWMNPKVPSLSTPLLQCKLGNTLDRNQTRCHCLQQLAGWLCQKGASYALWAGAKTWTWGYRCLWLGG